MKQAVIALIFLVLAFLILVTVPDDGGRIYDCSLAEFHPDYPAEVKAECRKLRTKKSVDYI
jgi:hypothetical protein